MKFLSRLKNENESPVPISQNLVIFQLRT